MKVSLVILFLFLSTSLTAQNIKAGVIAGVNATQVDGDTYAGYRKLGINVGGTAIIPFSKKTSISMEILFSQKGSYKKSHPNDPTPNSYKLKLDYVDVPILFNFKFKEEEKVTFGTGLTIGTLVNFKEIIDGLKNIYTETPYKKMDLNWMVNILYEIIPHLHLNFRYAYTLGYIRNVTINNIPKKQKNNLISFRLVYML